MAVDECLNDPITIKCVHELCSKGLISGAVPLWNQIRVREDGSIFYVLGGVSKNLELPFDVGKPEKHAGWDDLKVASLLVAGLINKNVVLLTANTRRDEFGLRNILSKVVEPLLDEPISLIGLFKKGKTTHAKYTKKVRSYMEKYEPICG